MSQTSMTPPARGYATLRRRFNGLIVDVAILFLVFLLFAFSAEFVELGLPGVIAMFASLLLYEPLLVGIRGATIGHRVMKLRVWRDRSDEPIGVLRAAARSIAKMIFGLPSFVFMALTRKHQALHDKLSGSVVVVTDPELVEHRLERVDLPDGPAQPRAGRRFLAIFAYALALVMVAGIPTYFVPEACLNYDQCTPAQMNVLTAVAVVIIVGWIAIALLGWTGRLPGARRPPT